MSDTRSHSRGSMRKLTLFIAFIVLLFGGLSGGWYWASGKLDEQVGLFSNNLAKNGQMLDCADRDIRGYPFRIGVFCNSVRFENPQAGINISGNGFRSAAQLYRPGHIVAELVSPYELVVPGLAPLTLDWENLKSSSNIGTSGFQRISIVADQIAVSANDFGQRDLLGSVQQLQFHARASETHDGQDLDLALSGDQWQIDDNEANLIEPVSFSLDGQVSDGFGIIQSGLPLETVLRSKGGKVEVKGFVFTTRSGGELRVSGPVEISSSGLLSAQLSLDLEDPNKLIAYATSVFPPAGDSLNNISQYLDAFADKTGQKVKIKEMKIQIKDGKVFIGFFQISEIPRLF